MVWVTRGLLVDNSRITHGLLATFFWPPKRVVWLLVICLAASYNRRSIGSDEGLFFWWSGEVCWFWEVVGKLFAFGDW